MINDCRLHKAIARTQGWIDYSFLNKLCKTYTFHTAKSPRISGVISIFEFEYVISCLSSASVAYSDISICIRI
ncbi:hypothetical protein FQN60_002049 [Etheostoma spectabile]|uniref:Uncharacterized protein n=1 Tax=Etheostoma spectabile TaxID=54343 RepID=A0A5J5DD97_9PERO|nr:hypothetical protein FQN60_002049 [Etheostoma spectabile]